MGILLGRRMAFLFLFVLVLLPLSYGRAGAQLITNGGFETSGSGWTYAGGSAQTAGTLLTPAHTGNFYGMINTSGGTISQTVTIGTAGTYQLSFFLAPQLSVSLGTLNFSVQIGGVTTPLTYNITVLGLGGYNLYTVVANLPVGATNLIFTNLPGLLTSPLRLDDVSLVQIPGPVPGTSMISYIAVLLLALGLGRKQMAGGLRRLKGRLLRTS